MAIVKQILQTQKQWSFMKQSSKIKFLVAMKSRPWSCWMMLFHAWSLIVSVQIFSYNYQMKMFLTCMNFLMNFNWLWLFELFKHLQRIGLFMHDFFHEWLLILSVYKFYYNFHLKMFLTCMNSVIIQWFWKILQIGLPLNDFFHARSLNASVQNCYYNCHMKMFLTCMNFVIA